MPHHLRASLLPQHNTACQYGKAVTHSTREGKGPSRVRQTGLGKDSRNSRGGGVPSKHKRAECGTVGGVYTTTNGSLWLLWQQPRSQCYERRVHRQAGQPKATAQLPSQSLKQETVITQTFRKTTWAAGHRAGQGWDQLTRGQVQEQRGATVAQGVRRERITANAHCQNLGPQHMLGTLSNP